jgi:hypothetical protein
VTEAASLVIGADGKRSLVAGAVGARRYREWPVRSFASYSYWAGVPVSGGEIYQRPGRAVAVFPTNDGLTMIYAAAPISEFALARADLEDHYLRSLDLCGDLGERVRAGRWTTRCVTISAAATGPSAACTTSRSASPPSGRPRRSSAASSPPWPPTRRRPAGSSPPSPASRRPSGISLPARWLRTIGTQGIRKLVNHNVRHRPGDRLAERSRP